VSEAARDFVDETTESMELATRINGFHLNRDAGCAGTTPCAAHARSPHPTTE
jgi:hypothetical protein